MRLNLTDVFFALSYALDAVEQELLGFPSGHGKRVAYLSALMAKEIGIAGDELVEFVGCAILHDNALTEYISEEYNNFEDYNPNTLKALRTKKRHCVIGEKNIELLPFTTDVNNIILYHHEDALGRGPFKLKPNETPIKAQILHLADTVDMAWKLNKYNKGKAALINMYINGLGPAFASKEVIDIFKKSVTSKALDEMVDKGPDACLRQLLPMEEKEYTDEEIRNIAEFFARIVDYKSSFTKNHSVGVAEKADIMARHYNFDKEKITKYYFAAALHDIGKLIISNDILEKPGKLSEAEFTEIKDHALGTHRVLSHIKGMEDITEWASFHHEKLNGKGYPFGITAENLSKEDRLLACIDIYQALTEKRPYKDGMSHEKTISIMREMVENGELDSSIVEDMDKVFG